MIIFFYLVRTVKVCKMKNAGQAKPVALIAAFVFCCSSIGWGQNLVPNPSFECGEPVCDPVRWAGDYDYYVCAWDSPQGGTPDIFSTAILNYACFSSMPYRGLNTSPSDTHVGSHTPRTGQRFAGIITYAYVNDSSYREYIQTELLEPLVEGEVYCAEMYVSPADFAKYSNSSLGMHFNMKQTWLDQFYPLTYRPQVVNRAVLTDTSSWIRVCGAFQAEEPYKWMVIGNFAYNFQSDVQLNKQTAPPALDFAYHFIDDVSVFRLRVPDLKATGDTLICAGKTSRLKIEGVWDETKWTTLDDTVTVLSQSTVLSCQPIRTTRYLVRANICNMILRDTVIVTVLPSPSIDLGMDTTICSGSFIRLDAGEEYNIEGWNNGSHDRYQIVGLADTYSVDVSNDYGCRFQDQIKITIAERPLFDLGKDIFECEGAVRLSVPSTSADDILWSTGQSGAFIEIQDSGIYWVTLRNRCGESTDSVRVYNIHDLYVPNVITPNSVDDLNRKFDVVGLPKDIYPEIRIFNRWGEEVYYSKEYHRDWPLVRDEISNGLYFYELRIFDCRIIRGPLHVLMD